MSTVSLQPKIYKAGEPVSLSGEYIECLPTGEIKLHPSVKVENVEKGGILSNAASHWIRYGRI